MSTRMLKKRIFFLTGLCTSNLGELIVWGNLNLPTNCWLRQPKCFLQFPFNYNSLAQDQEHNITFLKAKFSLERPNLKY